jgi:hypothetical protein
MPYPLSEDRDNLLDMMEPRDRLFYEQMEEQMQLTRHVLHALTTTRVWATITGLALAVSVGFQAVAHLWPLIFK